MTSSNRNFISVFVGLALFWAGGALNGHFIGKSWRENAIKQGYALYTPDTAQWRWKTPEEVAFTIIEKFPRAAMETVNIEPKVAITEKVEFPPTEELKVEKRILKK